MDKIIQFLKKIIAFLKKHIDKVQHFLANLVMALSAFWDWHFAIGLCIGASLGKEYGDSKASGNHWCWWDLLADALGMGTGLLIVYLIKGGF